MSPLRVLARPAFKNRDKLPYNHLLYSELVRAGARVEDYTFRRALTGRHDVFHLHWPESLLETRSLARCLVSAVRAMLALFVLRRRGTAIVWTGHDVAPHDLVHPWLERRFFAYVLRRLDGLIAMTPAGRERLVEAHPVLADLPFAIVPHGHFRGFFEDGISQAEARARLDLPATGRVLLFFGQIRPYKGLEALLDAFAAAGLEDTTLLIAGRPNRRSDHAARIQARIEAMANVKPALTFVPNEAIQLYMRAADLVVCPFERILNSGSVILALSFDRPVLAPALGALPELADEVGQDWLRLYEGPLTPDLLRQALSRPLPGGQAPLAAFDWPAIANATLAAFERFRRRPS